MSIYGLGLTIEMQSCLGNDHVFLHSDVQDLTLQFRMLQLLVVERESKFLVMRSRIYSG